MDGPAPSRDRLWAPCDAGFLAGLKVVSWDVDGTLYSMRAVMARVAWNVGAAWVRGRGPGVWSSSRAFLRHRRAVQAARLAGASVDPIAPTPTAEAFVREVFAPAVARIGLRPGVLDTLAAFRARGVAQVVASDYDAAEKLAALGLPHTFQAAYAGDRLGMVKPHPGMLARIAADFDCAPGEMLHIGDGPATDGAAAAAFGCRCLLVGSGGANLQALAAAVNASQVRV